MTKKRSTDAALLHLSGLALADVSALGKLEALARLGLAVFLAFHHAAVAGQEACGLKRGAQTRSGATDHALPKPKPIGNPD